MVSVAILIDLRRNVKSGGQVKCWERFAEAAGSFPDEVDLSLYFQGERYAMESLYRNVRYITFPPLFSTARFRSMNQVADHTDLAPLHVRLLPRLKHYQVIHTTDAFFALARTGAFASRRYGIPLVNSIHSDIPRYTALYSQQIIRNLTADTSLSRFLLERLRIHHRLAEGMERKLRRYLRRCCFVLVSNEEDRARFQGVSLSGRVSFLRRGIDKERFHPRHRDRERLEQRFGIKADRFVLLFVGRVDQGKNVMTLARAARILLERGHPVHVLVVGEGAQEKEVRDLLGAAGTLTGVLPHSTLAWLYASSDAFVFPSEIEVRPNAVIEARASGLPVLVPHTGGAAYLVERHGEDGFRVPAGGPLQWADLLETLIRDPRKARAVGEAARRIVERRWPSWEDVLAEDLLPVWRSATAGTQRRKASCSAIGSSF